MRAPLRQRRLSLSDVHAQYTTYCATGCCGCASSWNPTCFSDVPACQPCTGNPPHEFPNAPCSNGRWVVQGSQTGGLTVDGLVLLVGDYTLPTGSSLIIKGMSSQLNVTGKVLLREAVTLVLSDQELQVLKPLGFFRQTMTYVTAGATQPTIYGSGGGSNAVVYAHSKRACMRPFATTSGDTRTFTVSVRYVNNCNTWWIIVLCCSPSFIGVLAGVIIPFL